MSAESLAALPADEKRMWANEMRRAKVHVEAIGDVLGVNSGTISRWTNPKSARRDRDSSRLRMRIARGGTGTYNRLFFTRRPDPVKALCTCGCEVVDINRDRYCHRPPTCVICSKIVRQEAR